MLWSTRSEFVQQTKRWDGSGHNGIVKHYNLSWIINACVHCYTVFIIGVFGGISYWTIKYTNPNLLFYAVKHMMENERFGVCWEHRIIFGRNPMKQYMFHCITNVCWNIFQHILFSQGTWKILTILILSNIKFSLVFVNKINNLT